MRSSLAGQRSLLRKILSVVVIAFCLMLAPALVWGPAAFAQDEDGVTPDEIENMADPGGLPSTDDSADDASETEASTPKKKKSAKKSVKKPVKKAVEKKPVKKPAKKIVEKKPVKKVTKKPTKKSGPSKKVVDDSESEESGEDISESEDESTDETESVMTEEKDPVRRMSNARELAVRVVGLGRISVAKEARKFVPKDLETRLAERLVQDLAAKTYFEPQAMEGVFNLRTRAAALAAASKKGNADGVLVFEIGLEEIKGFLASASGRRIRTFDFKYRVGELEEKNAVSILGDRIVEGVVQAIPYRGFVTATDKAGTGTVNLGSNHAVKEGDILHLFELRRPNFNSTHRQLLQVQVKKVVGPSESQVAVLDSAPKGTRIDPFAKVSFALASTAPTSNNPPMLAATDHSPVSGRWWFGFGGEVDSYGAEAAAPQYESKTFKINSAPFFYAAAGTDFLTFKGAFGSGRSETETLGIFDFQGIYTIYQLGGAQSAWTIGAGARLFYIRVTPNPNTVSALETTIILSPMAEFKYQYVPRGRIRLVGVGEIFWPIYTTGASIGALPFAFGAGAGAGIQLAITSKFGFEVMGRLRYLRRPIDGQSGVQERQSILGAGLLFSF